VAEPILTIGHSNHALEHFLQLISDAGIGVVVDVRSTPRSGYAPYFNREALEPVLVGRGVAYHFMGSALGGMPDDARFYDSEGYVLYSEIAATDVFKAGIASVIALAAGERVALMCGEEDPSSCHRRLMVGRVLAERGAEIVHVRGDGRLQTEDALRQAEAEARGLGGVGTLFDVEEQEPWRSIRSVSRRRPPRSSSSS
jgi:uncharacterized protein (DUF488 family)